MIIEFNSFYTKVTKTSLRNFLFNNNFNSKKKQIV